MNQLSPSRQLKHLASIYETGQRSFKDFHAQLSQRDVSEPVPWLVGELSDADMAFEVRFLNEVIRAVLVVRVADFAACVRLYHLDQVDPVQRKLIVQLPFLTDTGMTTEEQETGLGSKRFLYLGDPQDAVNLLAKYWLQILQSNVA